MKSSLPPLLAPDLDVVFVGTEPGRRSLELGFYYANATNRFYEHLAQTRFTPRQIAPSEFRELLAYAIGLDDVYSDPGALRQRIEAVAPRSVCFNSKEALRRFAGVRRLNSPWRGGAARRYADIGDVTWALPDSSWQASQYWNDRINDLAALRRELALGRGADEG
jgi:double-stranded uracil-DNA glycosylase